MEKPNLDLNGKTALITGVGRTIGIGAAIARAFAAGGADIFFTYFSPYDDSMPWHNHRIDPEVFAAELSQAGARCGARELDLGDAGAAGTLFDAAEQALGPIDILVNNAVHDSPMQLESLSAADFDQHYRVNLRAPALLSHEFFRRHDGRPGGRIINITSGQGLGPMPDQIAYAATKGGLEALTLSLVPALAARGITINAVDPGPTDTGWMDKEMYAAILRDSPLGRVGLPADAANLVRFLASDEAGWITGQLIRSRGGF